MLANVEPLDNAVKSDRLRVRRCAYVEVQLLSRIVDGKFVEEWVHWTLLACSGRSAQCHPRMRDGDTSVKPCVFLLALRPAAITASRPSRRVVRIKVDAHALRISPCDLTIGRPARQPLWAGPLVLICVAAFQAAANGWE